MGEGSLEGSHQALIPTGHVEKLELSLVAGLVMEGLRRMEGQEVDSEGLRAPGCWGRLAELGRHTNLGRLEAFSHLFF